MIISWFLVTFSLDYVLILSGENWLWSLFGVNGGVRSEYRFSFYLIYHGKKRLRHRELFLRLIKGVRWVYRFYCCCSIVKFTTENSNCENLLLVFRVIPRTNPRKLLKASNEVWRFSTSLFPPVDWLDLTNRRNIVAYCPAYCSSRNKKRMYEQSADGWRRHAN